MGKAFKTTTIALLCAGVLIAAANSVFDLGLFWNPPEARYLPEAEAQRRPVYQMLNDEEKTVYEAVLRGIEGYEDTIELPVEITGDDYAKVYCILEKQEGGIFCLGSSYFVSDKMREANMIYRSDRDTFDTRADELNEVKNRIIANMPESTDDYDKVKYIHDYITENCSYLTGMDDSYNSTAYGCLVEKKANCEGYSKAFNLLASEAGLRSVVVIGRTDKDENHAWNQVRVNGEWYNIDVTWDDGDDENAPRMLYFLRSDDSFGMTHFPADNNFIPFTCDAVKDNYYVRTDLLANSVEEAEEILRKRLRDGHEEIEILFADPDDYDAFRVKYVDNEEVFKVYIEERPDARGKLSASYTENRSEKYIKIIFS